MDNEAKAQAKKARLNAAAKGRRLVQLAKAFLEARGCVVEVAANQIRWWKNPQGRMIPRSVHHDLFGVWDLLAVSQAERAFYQVTTLSEVSHRREKILASGFPADPRDAILAWVGGRGRHFRVLRGPDFTTASAERWEPVKEATDAP